MQSHYRFLFFHYKILFCQKQVKNQPNKQNKTIKLNFIECLLILRVKNDKKSSYKNEINLKYNLINKFKEFKNTFLSILFIFKLRKNNEIKIK